MVFTVVVGVDLSVMVGVGVGFCVVAGVGLGSTVIKYKYCSV